MFHMHPRARAGCVASTRHLLPSLLILFGLIIVMTTAPAVGAVSDATTAVSTSDATPFNVESATRDYLNRLTPQQRARSDAYFEGGYWLQLWNLLYGLGIAAVLLGTGLSARMRDWAERITRFKLIHTTAFWIQYLVVTSLLGLPLSLYEGFFREHQYGMSNQTLAGWFGDYGKGMMVGAILGALALIPVFGLVRRAVARWHIYAALVLMAFATLAIVISPVFISPLFNQYTPLADPNVRDPILRLARANGIPASEVFQMDASRQTKRISANVSGALGTTRITLNDNLLNRCSQGAIEAVMGHEMGHYVLNHVYKMLLFIGVVVVVMMVYLRWSVERLLVRFGARWGIRGPGDLAVLPLAIALISIFGTVMTPIMNTMIRTHEMEADVFGLNAAAQPDGFAEAALLLSEYRKMEPGPIEEFLLYDHPSGATRIRTAMRWKAEHLTSTQTASRR